MSQHTSPSIEQFAAACGVSTATVSRVFNRRPNVREDTRKRVLEAAREFGYSPRITARRECVVIAVESYEQIGAHGYDMLMVSALAQHLFEQGYRLEIVPASDIEVLREKFVAGLIAMLYRPASVKSLARIEGVPVVTINEHQRGMPSVSSHDAQGISLAVSHLVERGHRRIVYLGKHNESFNTRRRSAAFAEAIRSHGLAASQCPVDLTRGTKVERLSRVLRGKPTAIVAVGEGAGLTVARALEILRVDVPGDVSLLSFEQPAVSEHLTPPHTTIAQDFRVIAERAIYLMREAGEGSRKRRTSPRVEIPYKLIERESVQTLNDSRH
jgi:LacI family transcriptional regulator